MGSLEKQDRSLSSKPGGGLSLYVPGLVVNLKEMHPRDKRCHFH